MWLLPLLFAGEKAEAWEGEDLVHSPKYVVEAGSELQGAWFQRTWTLATALPSELHRNFPLASRSAIGTLTWRSVFGGTSGGLTLLSDVQLLLGAMEGPSKTSVSKEGAGEGAEPGGCHGPLRAGWGGYCSRQGIVVLLPRCGGSGHSPDL